jgi:hypothetical protein
MGDLVGRELDALLKEVAEASGRDVVASALALRRHRFDPDLAVQELVSDGSTAVACSEDTAPCPVCFEDAASLLKAPCGHGCCQDWLGPPSGPDVQVGASTCAHAGGRIKPTSPASSRRVEWTCQPQCCSPSSSMRTRRGCFGQPLNVRFKAKGKRPIRSFLELLFNCGAAQRRAARSFWWRQRASTWTSTAAAAIPNGTLKSFKFSLYLKPPALSAARLLIFRRPAAASPARLATSVGFIPTQSHARAVHAPPPPPCSTHS